MQNTPLPAVANPNKPEIEKKAEYKPETGSQSAALRTIPRDGTWISGSRAGCPAVSGRLNRSLRGGGRRRGRLRIGDRGWLRIVDREWLRIVDRGWLRI